MKYLLLLLLPLAWACTESEGDVEKDDVGPPVALVDKAVSSPSPTLPVYDSFDELAPLFEAEPEVPTLINFWATWCKPCVEELPYFEQLRAEVPADELRIVLVSLDFPKQIETKLKPFLAQRQLKSEVVVLTDGKTNDWIGRVEADWEGAIPVTLIRSAKGRDFHFMKFKDYAGLEEFVEGYL